MDQNLIYAKTPIGDEAVRQSTRVVQRNLRMVLVQVDGKLTVGELSAKVGNANLVESALTELEKGGFIAPTLEAASVWEESMRAKQQGMSATSPASQFSTFGPKALQPSMPGPLSHGIPSVFSTFGKALDEPEEVRVPATKESVPKATKPRLVRERMPFEFKPAMIVKGMLLIALIAVCGALFYPYGNHRADFEGALAKAFGAPMSINSVSLGIQPKPGLYLHDIRIGEQGDSRIDDIRILSPLGLLAAGHKVLNGLEISGATFAADRLASLGSDGAISKGEPKFSIGQVAFRDLKVLAGEAVLGEFLGDVFFKPGGGIERIALQSPDGTLRVDALPAAAGLDISIVGHGWKPAGEHSPVFDSLQAKAFLQRGKLVVQDLDTGFLGGVVKGNWILEWNQALLMTGEGSFARVSARQLSEGMGVPVKFDGEITGSMRIRGSGSDWSGLWGNSEAVFDGDIVRGSWLGVDLGEAARRNVSRSGNTKFESLKGNWRYAQRKLTGKDLRLDAGLLTANGFLSAAAGGEVSGNFNVTIGNSLAPIRSKVRIAGTVGGVVAEASR